MSAILSTDDLNDFIAPGVACIKPVETLPKQHPDATDASDPYEVTTEDKLAESEPAKEAPPAEISLTDCLACSGCVTSAEAVLVSLQSHDEVLSALEKHPSATLEDFTSGSAGEDARVFVASISPQARASLAATYGVSEGEAGHMLERFLCGAHGLKSGGAHGSGFTTVLDTNAMREVCLAATVEEVRSVLPQSREEQANFNGQSHDRPKLPVLASSCPGWICYAEKTHPHILPHLSRLKSPQAMSGTLVKSILSRKYGIPPDNIWHLSIMPCFDKKLEASREELTDAYWRPDAAEKPGIRDVDCVITAREILMLAEARGISFPSLQRTSMRDAGFKPFRDPLIDTFLFPNSGKRRLAQRPQSGPSGGFAYHILEVFQQEIPESQINIRRGRNADVVEYILTRQEETLMKTARYYGFQNIQNLVRKLKPQQKSRLPGAAKVNMRKGTGGGNLSEYCYIEAMACPGGCTNGGGQIKVNDLPGRASDGKKAGPAEQKEWLVKTDEAYFSAEPSEDGESDGDEMDIDSNIDRVSGSINTSASQMLDHWQEITNLSTEKLLFTSFRQVQSDVGKNKNATETERIAGLANSLGGGW
ncbi:MAG: Cytosolic Fe-S cluster assembly factor nar1 [Alyxoria varia]|nr:MAG: Cytosolic Fe-S cluster assembly factor nar1 [Alyxoria varia]